MDYRKPFWKWLFCHKDGRPSLARIGAAVLTAFALGWTTGLFYVGKPLPDLGSAALILTVLYGVDKGTAALRTTRAEPMGEGEGGVKSWGTNP